MNYHQLGRILLFNLMGLIVLTNGLAQIKKEYEIKKLANDVYAFIWKDPMQNPVEGNSLFIINEQDVVVVDACAWPSSAETMISELKKLTNKPVRYVINTHWHNDHIQGNFLYKKNWPAVEFISHSNTRRDIIKQVLENEPNAVSGFNSQIEMYSKWLKDGQDNTGKALDSSRRKRIADVIEFLKESIVEFNKVEFVVPDLVYEDSMILYRNDRVIKILWLGRGNTSGDAIIFLPKEKIAATGDLFVYPVPFGIGSFYKEWIHTLTKLDSLDAGILVPGHGFPQYDRNYLHQVEELLKSLVSDVESAAKQGLSLEETQKKVTLPEWKKIFTKGDPLKERSFDLFFIAPAVERAWHQAKGEELEE